MFFVSGNETCPAYSVTDERLDAKVRKRYLSVERVLQNAEDIFMVPFTHAHLTYVALPGVLEERFHESRPDALLALPFVDLAGEQVKFHSLASQMEEGVANDFFARVAHEQYSFVPVLQKTANRCVIVDVPDLLIELIERASWIWVTHPVDNMLADQRSERVLAHFAGKNLDHLGPLGQFLAEVYHKASRIPIDL